ncbi:MAG TPA: TonB-dependent receptor [Caulobacteraceae bacterium]|jgi:outer membrane receptor protein involved in Fe transport
MISKSHVRAALFAGAAASALAANQAYAQAASAPAAGSNGSALEEVVVTATRQSNSVNRVALSIAAVTQQTIDQQGLKQSTDLVRTVPGLTANVAQTGLATFAIRGIVANVGAATVGTYLDDTSLTRRNNAGVSQNPGANQPVLFDLERVEVLKGPQGTLYGGSSEGGTIRFITPQPSLTHISGAARAEVSDYTGGGQPSYEVGAGVGGPIVQDKLGFRISGIERDTGGWVRFINPYNGSVISSNANENRQWSVHGQLLWQATERATVSGSYYHSDNWNAGASSATTDQYSPNGSKAPAGQTYTTNPVCDNVTNAPTTLTGAAYTPPTVACPTNAVAGQTVTATVNGVANQQVYQRPGATYGPFTLGKRDQLATTQLELTPGYDRLDVGSMTLAYHLDRMDVKSITSYVTTHDYSEGAGGEDPAQQQSTTLDPTHTAFPLWSQGGDYPGHFLANNQSNGLEQELRFSSVADGGPLTWVAGLYFEDTHIHVHYEYRNPIANGDRTELLFRGITAQQRYGVPNTCNCQAELDATITDDQFAGYGEGSYKVTDKLKVTAGVRVTRLEISYYQLNFGQFSSRTPTNPASLTQGSGVDSPVTPKFGVEYDLAPNQLVYATAAQGFRAGGVNPAVAQSVCQTGLTALGITATQIPAAYGSDSVWSYELGGKFRLLDNRLQLNAAIYRIDWSGVQSTVTIGGCGQSFVMNGGRAKSQGVDLQAEFRPISPLTLTLNAGYDDAKYVDPVRGPSGGAGVTALPTINAGDALGVPPWQVSLSAQWNFMVMGKYDAYVRADDQWQSSYTNGPSYGVSQYSPFTRFIGEQNTLNARVGTRLQSWDVSLFALNVADSRYKIGNAGNGIGACASPSAAVPGGPGCTTYTTWSPFVGQTYQRPRVVGIQANYRF